MDEWRSSPSGFDRIGSLLMTLIDRAGQMVPSVLHQCPRTAQRFGAVLIQILKSGGTGARDQTSNLTISDAALISPEPQSARVKVGNHSVVFLLKFTK